MKKGLFVVLMLVTSIANAACILGGSICYDENGLTIQGRVTADTGEGIPSMTKANTIITSPKQAGQLIFCSDCSSTSDAVCVSSGTGKGAYVKISSATTSCG